MQKKALYVRLKGILEGVNLLFLDSAETFINKRVYFITTFFSVVPAKSSISLHQPHPSLYKSIYSPYSLNK